MFLNQLKTFSGKQANNLFLGPDSDARYSLCQLRALVREDEIVPGTPLTAGVYFDLDPAAEVAARFVCDDENMVSIRAQVTGTKPAYFALHIRLGAVDVSGEDVIGFVCKSRARSSVTSRVALRSARPGGFVDHFLPKTIVSFQDESLHLDAVTIAQLGDVPKTAAFRELIIFFEPGPLDLDICDMRIFLA